MDMNYANLEFAENREARIPIVLVLDCSDSMMEKREGELRTPFEALNGGLDTLWAALHGDDLAKRRAEVSFITFGSDVSQPTDFATVEDMVLPELAPMGVTSLAEALEVAMDAIEDRKRVYKDEGIQYYRPILMVISDGLPTSKDSAVEAASQRLKEFTERKKLTFMPIAVDGADVELMGRLSGKPAARLQGMKFDELFQWLSASIAIVSASRPGNDTVEPETVKAAEGMDSWLEL